MKLSIVTPEAVAYTGEVEGVVLPGSEGELGALPMHARLVTLMAPGEMSYREATATHYMVIGDGFAEITPDSVTIMTDMAAVETEIDEEAEEQAIERARAALKDADHTPEEEAAVVANIARATARIEFKRRRRKNV